MKINSLFLSILIFMAAPYATGQPIEKKDSIYVLNEVVVKASIPQVRKNGPISTIKVKGTILSKMGNVSTMLSNTPGLHKGASGLEVNGLGKPIFILNDREIDPDKVLDLLQANTVKEIKINKAPDITYSTDGRPTVEIILFRPVDDLITLSVGNDMAVRRKISDAGTINFGINSKKVSSTIDFMGGIGQFQNKETYFRSIYHPQNISVFDQRRTDTNKELPQRLRWSLDYDIDKYNRLGLEYYYQFSKKSGYENGTDLYSPGNWTEVSDFYREKKSLSNLHNISLQYNYKKGKKTFQIVQDFGVSSSHRNVMATNGSNPISVWSHAHNDYYISTTNLKFGTVIPLKIRLQAGIKYSYIGNKSNSDFEYPRQNQEGYKLLTDIIEHDPQAYLSFSRKIGNVTINAGGRYRYMYRKVRNGDDNSMNPYTKHDISSFFPLVSLTYRNSTGTSFYVRYNRTITHPSFKSLNSGYIYMDSLTYTTGNPYLSSAFTNIISAGVNWKDFTFSARYTHISDPIVTVSEPMTENSDIIVERDINMKYDNSLRLSIEYSKTISKLNLYAEGSVAFPYGKYYFQGKEYTADKIEFHGNLNLNYRINSFMGAYLSFNYQGANQRLTLTQKAVNNLSAGVVASLLNNRLTMNLALTDILNGAHYNNITYRYGNVSNGTHGTNDQRGIILRLNYTIFSKKIKTRTNRLNEEELQRFY